MSEQNKNNIQCAMRKYIKVKLKSLLHQIDNDDVVIDVILFELTELQNNVNSAIELQKQIDEFNDYLNNNLSETERKIVLDMFDKLQKQLNKVNDLFFKDLGKIESYLQKNESHHVPLVTKP